MLNSSRTIDNYDPKLKLLQRLIEECFSQNVSHSTIYRLRSESNNGESDIVAEAKLVLAIAIAVEGATSWKEIDKFWAITAKAHLEKLYNEKGTLLDYLNGYQILKGSNGYKLLIADFDRLYPAAGADILRSSLHNVSGNIIAKGKALLSLTKNQFLKLALTELLTSNDDEGRWCPPTFDGFACWDATPPAAVAVQRCPAFIVGFDPARFVYKSCTENGTWYRRPEATKPWTNYTTCVDMEDLDFRSIINNVYVAGYSISVAALLLSLIIFVYFRSLQCTRIRIHMHLFMSFALNNILWIVWYKTVVNEVTVVQDNELWCQALHVVTNYFMVTSYLWMFCEGLHLHIALVVVFVKDEVAMRWFVAVGWGLSLGVVATYAAVRYNTPGATERCWMDQSDSFWIIVVPVLVSLLSSFVFLVNVVRVLLTKLHPAPNQHARLAARKAARAALILIPLFGLHFVLIPLHPSPGARGEKIYQVVSALLTSLQGLCVAFLFCFTNHDVMVAMRTHMTRVLRANDAIALTGLTAGESLANTRENVV